MRKNELLAKLDSVVPSTTQNLVDTANDSVWDERLQSFEKAWKWARERSWLEGYIRNGDEQQIHLKLKQLEDQINDTVAELATQNAWLHCFERLEGDQHASLKAWAYEHGKIGKGTGKYASQHRQKARQHMENCRKSIPVWILPLYKLAETIKPKPGMFDVIIIDEASQSGPDAFFLLYIAKKIIVVGDDKQISPDFVSVPKSNIRQLQETYLNDIPPQIVSALDTDSSFFSLADILFCNQVVLQEHFRCVPEIIRFSNDLSYRQNPLIPLRSYPPNRLEPIKTVHIKDGYRPPQGKMKETNLPEAEAIAKIIKECCENSKYDGKSFGVISLLGGEHQANLILNSLLKEVGQEEIESRNLTCGNAYAFQGDERDVIFLSLVATPKQYTSITSSRFQKRFNVAASRAKDQIWLFHSVTLNDIFNQSCLRYKLLYYYLNYKDFISIESELELEKLRHLARSSQTRRLDPPKPFDSWFEVDVYIKIADLGYRVIPQFEAGRYYIDLVIEGMHNRLAVECDGDKYHSAPDKIKEDAFRERELRRSDWTFWRVRGSEFYLNPDVALQSLWDKLKELKIGPGGKDIADSPSIHCKIDHREIEIEDNLQEQELDLGLNLETPGNGSINDITQNDRLQSSLNKIHSQSRSIENIKPNEIKLAILSVLKQSSNSCAVKNLTKLVCKHLHVITRGQPRKEFEKRVNRMLGRLKAENLVMEYKAKNQRIKLITNE